MSELQELHHTILECTRCDLHRYRTRAVPGEGPEDAEILFIGEGPGFHEDQQGRPFVGPSGNLLEELLASIGMTRQEVFIANVIKCRPPDNRDPNPSEIEACAGYLERQIELIDPRLIVTLGRYSMEMFFPQGKISRIHGRARRDGTRLCLPLYHPAYALRNPRAKRDLQEDMARIPKLLAKLKQVLQEEARAGVPEREPETQTQPEGEPRQLTLF